MKPIDLATLLTLGALWGCSYVFIRIGAPVLGPLPFNGARVALAAMILWTVLRVSGQSISLRPYARRLLVLGLINSALPLTLIATAELRLTASDVAVLGATAPLFAACLGAVWLRERVSAVRGIGLLLGVVGVAILTGFGAVRLDAATALSIGGVLTASLSYAAGAMYARLRLAGASSATLALGQQLGALAWLAIPAVSRLPHAQATPGAVSALFALSTLCTALAFVLYFRLIARVGPTLTSTVTYIAPVFGMLAGSVFLGERITVGMVTGFAIIALSLALVNDSWMARLNSRRPIERSAVGADRRCRKQDLRAVVQPAIDTQNSVTLRAIPVTIK